MSLLLMLAVKMLAQPKVDPNKTYQMPVDTRPALAGNYGELRPNHFHAGLDFKTDQTVGHPVYSFDDGFVYRVTINAYGYGLVVYVAHPGCGLLSVYAHLDDFSDKVWARMRQRQVEEQLNNADITFMPDEIPVRKGEVIAISGNTGSSAGPHVHFELRSLNSRQRAVVRGVRGEQLEQYSDEDEEWFDPLPFFVNQLDDTTPPRISHIYLYPQSGEGVACGTSSRQTASVIVSSATEQARANGNRTINKNLTAWGRVGLALKAYDYMDAQANKYGVKYVRLYCDERLIYSFAQHYFTFAERRYTNSVIDYRAWRQQGSMIMKSFVEPGNHLRMIDETLGDGVVDFNEERPYNFRYELEDAHGNRTHFSFVVKGVKRAIPPAAHHNGILASARHDFRIDSLGFHFFAPAGMFYNDTDLKFSVNDNTDPQKPCLSKVYRLGTFETTPIHNYCDLQIDVPDSLRKYAPVGVNEMPDELYNLYIANLDGGVYLPDFLGAKPGQPARLCVKIRDFGRFAVRRDTSKPHCGINGKPSWKTMSVSAYDTGSGVELFCVFIDGKFVPFDMNNAGRYVGHPYLYGIERKKSHDVEIIAVDKCGNETRERTTVWF